jgi:hypothetical protein
VQPAYLLFSGGDYYPSGGANDYMGSFVTLDEAEAWVVENMDCPGGKWAHACIMQAGQLVRVCDWIADKRPEPYLKKYPNGQQVLTHIYGWKRKVSSPDA